MSMTTMATTPAAPSDAEVLAREMATAFGRTVKDYQKYLKLPYTDAMQRAGEPEADGGQRILHGPPDQVNWYDLHLIARTDPDRAMARWEEIKRAALDELQSGHRAARAGETAIDGAWQRAQFLALRDDLAAEWNPRNGIEHQLLDTMAQAQTCYMRWLQTLTARTALSNIGGDRLEKEEGKWQAPRQTDADAIDQAAEMMDRFNRIFLRTLRALRDLRRYSGPVFVQNAGQVNVGGQQVNMTTTSDSTASGANAIR
jgi:hypothetical protein